MSEKHFVIPALHAEVKLMGYDAHYLPIPSESTKVKLVDLHPTKSLFVYVDGDGRIIVWDFNLKMEILNVSGQDVFNVAQSVLVQPLRDTNSFIKQRLSHRSQMNSLCKVDHILKNDYCSMIAVHDTGNSSQRPKSTAIHTIKSVNFCDASAIFSACYSAGKHSIHQSAVHSSNSLLIVSDNSVVIYDYASKKGQVISEIELTKAPSGAEMLYHNCCAIGCVDGSIRLWDCKTHEVVKILSGHTRGAVTVKAIPIRSDSISGTVDHLDKVRLLSIGIDGAAFIWDITISIGLNGNVLVDAEGGNPTARLKDLLATSTIAKSNIHFDCETNLLSISVSDSKIKQWDMSDINSVTRSSLRSAGTSSSQRNKRMSLMNVVAGGNRDQYDHIHGISCLGAMKPGEKKDKKVDVTAFSHLNALQFSSDSFAIASKTNVIGIYKNREGVMGDDKSEKSSVVGGATEKSQRLQLLHELNISAILIRYFETTVAIPEILKELLKTGALRVYSMKFQTSQPHIFLLGTSFGVLLLSLKVSQIGSMCGVHPTWGNIKLIYTGSGVRKVIMDGIDGKNMKRVASGRQSFNTDDGAGDLDLEVSMEIIGELNTGEPQAIASSVPKRLSFAPSTKKVSAVEFPAGRPQFYPSPSGEYCAVHWVDTLHYIVIKMDIDVRTRKDLIEVDRGYAIEFAWIGTENYYLIKSAAYIATVGAKKRASIINLLSAAEKEVSRLHNSQLVLCKCEGENKSSRVQFTCDSLQGLNGATTAIHLHSGLLVAITTEVIGDVVSVKNPAALGEAINGGVIVADFEKAERDVKYAAIPNKSRLITRLYSLVTVSEAKRIEASALEASNKPSGKNKKAKAKSGDETIGVDDAAAVAPTPVVAEELNGFTLVQVGPAMNCVDSVRWNYQSGLCAILNNKDINIVRLQLDSNNVKIHSISNVSVAHGGEWSVGITDLTWSDSCLFAASANKVYVVNCDSCSTDAGLSHHVEVCHLDYLSPLINAKNTVASNMMALTSGCEYSPMPWNQVIGVQNGHVYIYFRDGIIKKINASHFPVVSLCLLLKFVDEEKQFEVMELLKTIANASNVTERQIVKSILAFRGIEI